MIGHEVAHIANGDMVTMTLIQGVMNTFVVFLSRVIGYAVDSFLRKGDSESSGPGIGYYVTTIVMDILLGFVAAIIGGLASYPLAAAGSLLVGLLESYASFWASAYKEVIVFTLILPVLLWRSLAAPHHDEEEEA